MSDIVTILAQHGKAAFINTGLVISVPSMWQ